MAKVVMYTKDWCPYCVKAKNILNAEKISFEEINIEDDYDLQDEVFSRAGRRTVPQIFIDDQPIGGADDLQELKRSGKLAELVK